MIALSEHAQGVILAVRAQPGARKNAVIGEHGGALKVAVSAAPERGKANDALVEVLASALGCRPSAITLMSGGTSRDKRFLIEGIGADELRRRIEILLEAMEQVSPQRHKGHKEKNSKE